MCGDGTVQKNGINLWEMENKPYKILIKYASRGRPERFFDGMESIYNLCSDVSSIRVLVTADIDDALMNNSEVRERVSLYQNAHIIYGVSNDKIHATNRDMDLLPEEWNDWNIIANFSDDQRFNIFGWDKLIWTDFQQVSPGYSHFMAYLDADTKGVLSTLFIAGRRWYDMFGWIYDGRHFKSLFCDNLVEDCAKRLGKYHYTGYSIYTHLNPSYGHLPKDPMYEQQQIIGWSEDQATYNRIINEVGLDNYLKELGIL
jgi:hypothetical protein